MKRTTFLLVMFLSVISCKKNEEKDSVETPQTDLLYPTGLIPATPDELASIQDARTLDTNLIQVFARTGRMANASAIPSGLPEADDQVYGSCQSWALGYYTMSYYYRTLENNTNLLLSPSFIFNQTATDPKQGVSFKQVLEFAKQKGTCQWSYMKGNPTNFLDRPSAEATKDALNFTITDIRDLDSRDMVFFKAFLNRNVPVILGLRYDNAWQLDGYKNNSDYILNTDGSYVWKHMNNYKNEFGSKGYHAVVVCGYSDVANAFLIKNSWGKKWGQNGYMWVDLGIIEKTLGEAYVVFPRYATTNRVSDGLINVDAKGRVYTWGNFKLTAKGFCYSTDPSPTTNDLNDLKVETSISTEGAFTLPLQGLKANKKYYLRAYASNFSETYYGNEQSFTTGNIPDTLTVTARYWVPSTTTNHTITLKLNFNNGIVTGRGRITNYEFWGTVTGSVNGTTMNLIFDHAGVTPYCKTWIPQPQPNCPACQLGGDGRPQTWTITGTVNSDYSSFNGTYIRKQKSISLIVNPDCSTSLITQTIPDENGLFSY